jgi:hypothetical protein
MHKDAIKTRHVWHHRKARLGLYYHSFYTHRSQLLILAKLQRRPSQLLLCALCVFGAADNRSQAPACVRQSSEGTVLGTMDRQDLITYSSPHARYKYRLALCPEAEASCLE